MELHAAQQEESQQGRQYSLHGQKTLGSSPHHTARQIAQLGKVHSHVAAHHQGMQQA